MLERQEGRIGDTLFSFSKESNDEPGSRNMLTLGIHIRIIFGLVLFIMVISSLGICCLSLDGVPSLSTTTTLPLSLEGSLTLNKNIGPSKSILSIQISNSFLGSREAPVFHIILHVRTNWRMNLGLSAYVQPLSYGLPISHFRVYSCSTNVTNPNFVQNFQILV